MGLVGDLPFRVSFSARPCFVVLVLLFLGCHAFVHAQKLLNLMRSGKLFNKEQAAAMDADFRKMLSQRDDRTVGPSASPRGRRADATRPDPIRHVAVWVEAAGRM